MRRRRARSTIRPVDETAREQFRANDVRPEQWRRKPLGLSIAWMIWGGVVGLTLYAWNIATDTKYAALPAVILAIVVLPAGVVLLATTVLVPASERGRNP